MPRKHKPFEKKKMPPHERAERVIRASNQPVSTEAPSQQPDRSMRAIDEETPENSELEQTMEDYYAQTDAEGQGGEPKEPPDTNPLPVQHPEKPTRPPRHNM